MRPDDLEWSIDAEAFEPGDEKPPFEPDPREPPPPVTPFNWRAMLFHRWTFTLMTVVVGMLAVAVLGTWWQGESQRLALEGEIRAIDAGYQERDEGILPELVAEATAQVPITWLSRQAQLLVTGAAAAPLDWPAVTQQGQARVSDVRIESQTMRVTRIERSFVTAAEPDSDPMTFSVLEAYSSTSDRRWIRAPLPEMPERTVDQDLLDGAVRWTYSRQDSDAVDALAPLVREHFERLCAAGLPCPKEGDLEVRILDPDAPPLEPYWPNGSNDLAGYMAQTFSVIGQSYGSVTLERESFALTGIPVNATAKAALARQITLELAARWVVASMADKGAREGNVIWVVMTLRTATLAGLVAPVEFDTPDLGLYTADDLWHAIPATDAAVREALGLVGPIVDAVPPDSTADLWARLPKAGSLEEWLQQSIGPQAVAQLAERPAPIVLAVSANGPLDGIMTCFEPDLRVYWAGWVRGTEEAVPVLDRDLIERFNQTIGPVSLSPDGTRLLTAAGRRAFVLDTVAGRATRLPDAVDASKWQITWWGNDGLIGLDATNTDRYLISLASEPPTIEPLPIELNSYFLGHDAHLAFNLNTGSTTSRLDVFDVTTLSKVTRTFDDHWFMFREQAAARIWWLSTQGSVLPPTLRGVQEDTADDLTTDIVLELPSPDEDLFPQAFAVDSAHGQAAVSYNTSKGFRRVTVLYRLENDHAVEAGRFEQATSGVPQMGFSLDGQTLFLNNGNPDSWSGIDAYSTATAEKIGSAPAQSFLITVEDGLTSSPYIDSDGLYLDLSAAYLPIIDETRLAVWNGHDTPRPVGPPACFLNRARYRP